MIQDFIANPVIKQLAKKPYWTVNIDNKKPLDIIEYKNTGNIRGAKTENCLTRLSDVFTILNAIPAQFTYSLDAVRDNYVILDIEKKCPDDIKETLLKLPFLYGDISMSGQGFHLILPCPPLDEITMNKVAMKEEHGYYEILIHHYVTFTNNTIFSQYTEATSPVKFIDIWNELRTSQKNAMKKEYDVEITETQLDFPLYPVFKDAVTRNFLQRFKKTPADFNQDMSRYEFAVIGSIRYSLSIMLQIPMFSRQIKLDENQEIAVVYDIAKDVIQHRTKHEEIRDGKSMLLYQVINSFATTYNKDTKGQ